MIAKTLFCMIDRWSRQVRCDGAVKVCHSCTLAGALSYSTHLKTSQLTFYTSVVFPRCRTLHTPTTQSLAREFGPKGVHVAHVIIDGLIDTERVKGFAGEAEPGSRLDPGEIGKVRSWRPDTSSRLTPHATGISILV